MSLSTKEFCDFIKEHFGIIPIPWHPGADVKVAWFKNMDELKMMCPNWPPSSGSGAKQAKAGMASITNYHGISMDDESDLEYLVKSYCTSAVVSGIRTFKQIYYIGQIESVDINELI